MSVDTQNENSEAEFIRNCTRTGLPATLARVGAVAGGRPRHCRASAVERRRVHLVAYLDRSVRREMLESFSGNTAVFDARAVQREVRQRELCLHVEHRDLQEATWLNDRVHEEVGLRAAEDPTDFDDSGRVVKIPGEPSIIASTEVKPSRRSVATPVLVLPPRI